LFQIALESKTYIMLHNINISIHVLAGILAIITAIFAYATTKGGTKHKISGRIFLILIGIVIITAFAGVLVFRDRPFLTIVTFLSFYTSYSGYRVLKTKENGFQFIDFMVMLLVILVAVSFVIKMQSSNIIWHASVVYYLLFYLFLIVGFDMLRYFIPNLIRNPRFWVYDHIYKITGSFTALISAGAGAMLEEWQPYNQIIPALFSTIWLIVCLVYFSKYAKAPNVKLSAK